MPQKETSLAERIDHELIRLGYSSYTGAQHGWAASAEGQDHVVMGHPIKQHDVMLYNARLLLDALMDSPEGLPLAEFRALLARCAADTL